LTRPVDTGGAYTYDGNNLRVKKVAGGATTVYIFSGSKVIAEYDNGAAPASPSREYIYSGAALLAKIEGGASIYYHPDHLSNRVLTDSSGNTLGQRGHYPFGDTWYESGTTTKLQFTSYERDSESTNDYAMMRSYINRFGRFSSPDLLAGSLGNPQSLNRYAYVFNDPINLFDPFGLCAPGADQCVTVTADANGGAPAPNLADPTIITASAQLISPNRGNTSGQISQLRNSLINGLLNDPDCLSFLGGRGAGSGPLNVVENTPIDIQHVANDSGVQAVTSVDRSPASTVPTGAQIHINDSGLFFVPGLQVSFGGQLTLNTGTPRFQAAVLLHEFGHATGILGPDINAGVNQQNSAAVADHCKKTIQSFSNK